MSQHNKISVKRIYEDPEPQDGYRVFVDRLWPRGMKKEDAHYDIWLKEVAPSNALRKWFGHDPDKYPDFKKKYENELDENEHFETLRKICKDHKKVTLLIGAKDTTHSQGVVLKEKLEK